MNEEIIDDDSIPPYKDVDKGIPLWLKLVYIFVPIWGLIILWLYWNGNFGGWLDRGHWGELQQAANTKFPVRELSK